MGIYQQFSSRIKKGIEILLIFHYQINVFGNFIANYLIHCVTLLSMIWFHLNICHRYDEIYGILCCICFWLEKSPYIRSNFSFFSLLITYQAILHFTFVAMFSFWPFCATIFTWHPFITNYKNYLNNAVLDRTATSICGHASPKTIDHH